MSNLPDDVTDKDIERAFPDGKWVICDKCRYAFSKLTEDNVCDDCKEGNHE